ncbi:unnamed protein product [Eruca vesicaria subsp. sativa]|uniref:S-protein homolog n=1 Tax=Eruca vesicaria subsp. sativa TaxID=29727 RepID=A0ABC8L487_ERUVS|nr:unnamed protein product [Eruca vesicaria subsp. sativa]
MIGNVYGSRFLQGTKTTLYFRNGLTHNKSLMVHCKSGNNKPQYLKPGGIDYQFSFLDNLMQCTMKKGPDYKISKTFDAYKQEIGKRHGGSYNYLAKDDGIYHSNLAEPKLTKKFDWN